MRICDRISHGETVVNVDEGDASNRATIYARRAVNASVRIDAQDASNHYWHSPRDDWLIEKNSFGPIVAPFPKMWIEWRMPKYATAEGLWRKTDQERFAFYVEQINDRHIRGALYVARDGLPVVFTDTCFDVITNESGGYLNHAVYLGQHWQSKYGTEVPQAMIHPALLAIGWMNCRNVQLVDEVVPESVRKRRRKRNQPDGLSFKRIRVEPNRRKSSNATRSGKTDNHQFRQHMVRGHFKEYTEENKLFGKYTGTYWWDWQVRGDKSKGTIHHEYVPVNGES